VAIATGVPYSALAGDHAVYNYTSLRGERQDLLKCLAPRQQRHVRQFASPVVRDIITSAVLAGKLDLPGYFKDPRRYHRGIYLPPGMEPVDPLKESKANRDDMGAKLRSPQEIVARRGRDIEDVLDEWQEFEEMLDERQLTTDLGGTALANNPAALGATDGTNSLKALIAREIEDALDRRELLAEEN